nr:L,D-transpeptidase family protein [Bacteriovorax sp. HI3]
MKKIMTTLMALFITTLTTAEAYQVDEVRVYKTRHRMEMLYQGEITKVYTVMLSRGGMAPKRREGDKLVPEGEYRFDYKNPYSSFYKSIHINYPNPEDVARARDMRVNPGFEIFLHGMPNYLNELSVILDDGSLELLFPGVGKDWTAGCIALTNREMQEVWDNLEPPVMITIYH